MPPKKKDKGKKAAKPKEVLLGEFDLSKLSVPELQGFVLRSQKEVEKARNSRNFYQVERDRVEQFLEVSKREFEDVKAGIKSIEKEIDDLSRNLEEKQIESEEKLVYMEFERDKNIEEIDERADELKRDATEVLKKEQHAKFLEHREKERDLIRERQIQEDTVEEQQRRDKAFFLDMVEQKEQTLRHTMRAFEDMYSDLVSKLNLLKDVELHDNKEQKTDEYMEFVESHHQSLREMKDYFKGTTGRSLALIDIMKDEIKVLRHTQTVNSKARCEIELENKTLEPFVKQAKVAATKRSHYKQDQSSHAFTLKRIKEYNKQIEELEVEHEELLKKLKEVTDAKEDLKVQFVTSLRIIQDSLNAKNEVLESKAVDCLRLLEMLGVDVVRLRLSDINYSDCVNVKRLDK